MSPTRSIETTAPGAGPASPFPFRRVLALTCVVKIALAAIVPLTGDEAYFALWGMYPDFGYYDHPPMIGWWLWAMLLGGNSVFLVRVPAILTTVAAALIVRGVLRTIDRDKADLVATLFLLTPFHVAGIVSTTDTPLVFFSVVSAAFAWRAGVRRSARDALLAGLFLGAAFLSKYFAVLLGLAYAVYFPLARRSWRGLGVVVLIFVGSLPGIAVNVWWNYEHGWTNIMFNLFNRHGNAGFSFANPAAFLALTAYWLGPGVVWVSFAQRRAIVAGLGERWREAQRNGTAVFFAGALVPAAAFFALSWVKNVGFHWLMSFYPLFFVVLFGVCSGQTVRRMMKPTAWFSAVHVVVVVVFLSLPLEKIVPARLYDSVLLATEPEVVLEALAPRLVDSELASGSYAKAAMLEFVTGKRIPVLGPGSFNGRHDDVLTDFRELEGRNFVILETRESRAAAGLGWFREASLERLEVGGTTYKLLVGRGFDYEAYRGDVLQRVADRYYDIPGWLAAVMKESFFLVRYGLESRETGEDRGR
jgi:hypothetical protein